MFKSATCMSLFNYYWSKLISRSGKKKNTNSAKEPLVQDSNKPTLQRTCRYAHDLLCNTVTCIMESSSKSKKSQISKNQEEKHDFT